MRHPDLGRDASSINFNFCCRSSDAIFFGGGGGRRGGGGPVVEVESKMLAALLRLFYD